MNVIAINFYENCYSAKNLFIRVLCLVGTSVEMIEYFQQLYEACVTARYVTLM